MRDLLDILESKGIANRKPGALFADGEGNEITFRSVEFYPTGGGKYATQDELQQAINQVVQQLGQKPIETNWFRNNTGGFGIASFQNAEGQPLYFIRYFKDIAPNPTENKWDNQAGLGPYRYMGTAAVKTQSNATPQDILTTKENLTAADILDQVEAKFPGSELVTVTRHLATGGELPFTFIRVEEMPISAFQDYFCELLQPIALQTGQVDGEANDVAATFLADVSYSDCLINFGGGKTGELADSTMVAPNGQTIKISSKGKKGAEASVVNVLDSYNELMRNPDGQKIARQVSDAIDIVQDIANTGMYQGPIKLGMRFDLITEENADILRGYRKQPPQSLKAYLASDAPEQLKSLAKKRNTENSESVDLFYHILASLAHEVANHVNNHTSFTKDAALILNNSALVQVYTKVSARGQQWTLEKFTSKWPGSSVSAIALSAAKNYMSTSVKGKFTFVVNPVKKQLDDPQSSKADISIDREFKRSKVKAAPDERLGGEKQLGRKRRGQ